MNNEIKSIDEIAAALAKEVGDSLSKFIEVVNREFCVLRFKGIEFSKISICFHDSQNCMDSASCEISIWSTVNGTICTQYGEVDKDHRIFHVTGKNAIEDVFWLIQFWRMDLEKAHAAKLKTKPAPTLFGI